MNSTNHRNCPSTMIVGYQRLKPGAIALGFALVQLVIAAPPNAVVAVVGIRLGDGERYAEIVGVLPGSSAEKSGKVHPGDQVLAVGQGGVGNKLVSTLGKRPAEVQAMLTGVLGSSVIINILPAGMTDSREAMEVRLNYDVVMELVHSRTVWTQSARDTAWTNFTNNVSLTQVELNQWARITNGSPASFVSSVLGRPIIIRGNEPLLSSSTWVYGLTVWPTNMATPFSLYLHLKEGKVEYRMDVKPDGTNELHGRITGLSRPKARE